MKIVALFFCLFLVGCSIDVPNIKWCRDKGILGAHCNYTNEDNPSDIDKEEWDAARFGNFCTDEVGFAQNQLFFEQACEKMQNCNVKTLRAEYKKFMESFKNEKRNR